MSALKRIRRNLRLLKRLESGDAPREPLDALIGDRHEFQNALQPRLIFNVRPLGTELLHRAQHASAELLSTLFTLLVSFFFFKLLDFFTVLAILGGSSSFFVFISNVDIFSVVVLVVRRIVIFIVVGFIEFSSQKGGSEDLE